MCICCTLPGFDGPFLEVEDLLAFFIVRDEQGESMRGEGGRVVDRDEGGGGICAGRGAEGIGEPEGESVSSLCCRLLEGRGEEPCISRSWRCSLIELLKWGLGEPTSAEGMGVPAGMTLLTGTEQTKCSDPILSLITRGWSPSTQTCVHSHS